MGRVLKPIMKRVRALGEEFAVQGDRAVAAKYVKLHRKQPPGLHGRKRLFAKLTSFGQQLLEKQKAKVFYHLGEKQFKKYYVLAKRKTESTDVALLRILEHRIDNVIYRAGFVDSHQQARQLVNHAHFLLNNKKIDIPSIQVKVGDVITYNGKSEFLKLKLQDNSKNNQSVNWLSTKPDRLEIKVASLPSREEIEVPFDEKLIIEFYSR